MLTWIPIARNHVEIDNLVAAELLITRIEELAAEMAEVLKAQKRIRVARRAARALSRNRAFTAANDVDNAIQFAEEHRRHFASPSLWATANAYRTKLKDEAGRGERIPAPRTIWGWLAKHYGMTGRPPKN